MKEENKCRIQKTTHRVIVRIVVHCSATQEGKDYRKADVDRWHRAKGWNGCGYHYVIGLDGKIELGRNIEDKGAHVGAYNPGSVGIVYIGGLDKWGKAKDTRTEAQKESLLWLLTEMRRLYPSAVIIGHRDLPGVKKACPCFDAKKEYNALFPPK